MITNPLVSARYHGADSPRLAAPFVPLTCGAAVTLLCGRGDLNPHGVATNRT